MRIVNDKTENTLAVILHLSGFLNGMFPLIVPFVIWMAKKEQSPFLDQQGKAALNFQISVLIWGLIGFLFILFTIGIGALIVLPIGVLFGLLYIVFIIKAAMLAYNGKHYHYPFTWTILK